MTDASPAKTPAGVEVESPGAGWRGSAGDGDEARRIRTRARWGYGGFAVGVVLALAYTAWFVARWDYGILQPMIVWNLIWAPCVCSRIGLGLSRTRRPGPRSWRLPRLRTRTLMLAIAYVAFLFGVGDWAGKIGGPARQYHQKWAAADSSATSSRNLERFWADHARQRRANVEALRAGKIPEGLFATQRDFLRSLEADPKRTPKERKFHRDLITDLEERLRISEEQSADLNRRLAEYHDGLAAKYDRARWRPWLPVEPDPPAPK